jgi:uncharacterized protein YxjI
MGSYLVTRRWSLGGRLTVQDTEGTPRFEVTGGVTFGRRLSLRDPGGTELAVISRRAFARRYQVLAGGGETTVSPRGLFGRNYEIDSPAGPMEAHGNFSGREYAVTANGLPAVTVTQLRTFRERFAVDVADGQDDVLMLALILVFETAREDRRRHAG